MTLLDRLAGILGYTKAPITQAPAWLSAQAMAEQYNLPEMTLADRQLELYQRLSWVQIAVALTAQTAASQPYQVMTLQGEDTDAIENHPFEMLLRRPNPMYSRSEFLEATYSYRALTGMGYWWLNKPSEKAPPDELWVLPSEKITPIPDGRMFIRGYKFEPGGTEEPIFLEAHEVVQFRKWHPRNPFVGLSPVEALATIATGDMAMQAYNTNLFHKDNAKAPGALAWADPIDDETWASMKRDIKDQHGGTRRSLMMLRNVGKGGVQWVSMAMSQRDMEFLAGRQFNKEEIFATFAPGLSSVLDVNATEANAVAGKGTFIEFSIWPLLVSVAEKITNDILPYYGQNLTGEFEDPRPSDRQMDLNEQAAAERVQTIDELRQTYYQLEPIGDNRGRLLVAEVGKTLLGGVEETQEETTDTPQQNLAILDAKLKTATVAINAGVEPKKAFQVVGLPPEWVENPEPQPAQITQAPPRGQLTGPVQQQERPAEDATEDQRQQERKALRKWLKKRPHAQLEDFRADYLTDDEVKAIFSETEGGAGQDFFTQAGKATRKLPGADGNDAERAELERKHTDKLALALRKLMRLVVPPGTTSENITPDIAGARYQENSKLVRDAIVEMLLDAANLGAETGIAQVETMLGVRKQVGITGTNWDLVNENVLRWVLGSGGGFGEGYAHTLTEQLARTSERQIRVQVAEWIRNDLTYTQLVDNLQRTVFSRRRAETIATTEITRAYATGNQNAWMESRVISQMEWRISEDELVCPQCAPMAGQLSDVNGDFNGVGIPPRHQNCRCWLVPKIANELAQ